MINVEKFRETMQKISERVTGEQALIEKNNISVAGVGENEGIDIIKSRCDENTFKLLVMGRFSSGKSAFVNVLLGEKILPESALPTTALITEIYYGKEKRVVMYPKSGGGWEGGDEPFDIKPELSEIKKYCTINNNAGINNKEANRIDSVFEKMVVYWPLDILKDGVSIIDSPGTDDPYQNDYIVEQYVPKADAVLYCIPGNMAYSAKDVTTLNSIEGIGFDNPIIVTTYFDIVTDGMSDEEKNEFIDTTYRQFYSNHTKREHCHYVNSKDGMKAKELGSKELMASSGYEKLEAFIGTYLTENKGKEKISSVTSALAIYNSKVKKSVDAARENLEVDDKIFDERVQEAQKKVSDAEKKGELLVKEFTAKAKDAQERVQAVIPNLYDTIQSELTLEDFEPATDFSIWHPKKSSEQIADECALEIKTRNTQIANKWNKEQLSPTIKKEFENIAGEMQDKFDAFSADIAKANISMKIKVDAVNTEVSGVTRAASFAYALLTGDWLTALMGGVFGAGALARTLACQFAAGFIVGIIALFTPVGLPALVIAGLAGLIGGVGWNAAKASSSIKRKSVEAAKTQMAQDREKMLNDAKSQCNQIFAKASKALKDAVDADINEVKKNIELAEAERKDYIAKADERKAELMEIATYIEETEKIVDEIKAENKIA